MNYKFGIVGAGLIGGSLAKAIIDAYPDGQILVYDKEIEHAKQLSKMVPQAIIKPIDQLKNCDFIFLCTPVYAIIDFMENSSQIFDKTSAIIVDMGSTKSLIVEVADRLKLSNFIPGHILAGGTSSGPGESDKAIFNNQNFVTCPTNCMNKNNLEKLQTIMRKLNVNFIELSAQTHDLMISISSHTPQLISFMIPKLKDNFVKLKQDSEKLLLLNTYTTMSKFAKSDAQLWADIFISNKSNILENISTLKSEIQEFESLLQSNDKKGLKNKIQQSNASKSDEI